MEIHRKNWTAWARRLAYKEVGIIFIAYADNVSFGIELWKWGIGFGYWRSK